MQHAPIANKRRLLTLVVVAGGALTATAAAQSGKLRPLPPTWHRHPVLSHSEFPLVPSAAPLPRFSRAHDRVRLRRNPIEDPLDSPFVATWKEAASGDWFDPARWDTSDPGAGAPNNNSPPGSTYHAVIDATGSAYTVTLDQSATIDQLALASSDATLSINAGGVLSLVESATISAGTLRLSGGTISGGVLNFDGGALVASESLLGNVLDNVTLNGSVAYGATGLEQPRLRITNGMTLNGTLTLMGIIRGSSIVFDGTQTLGGDGGTLRFEGTHDPREMLIEQGTTLTIGPGVTVQGGNAVISGVTGQTGSQGLINEGTIRADTGLIKLETSNFENKGSAIAATGGSLEILSSAWTNTGLLSAVGGTLHLDGAWSNTGTMVVDQGTLNLGGTFTTGGMGQISRTGGLINITGTLDNTGSTLVLDSNSGNLRLHNGTIRNGTITIGSGGGLNASASFTNTLENVSIVGDLDLMANTSRIRMSEQFSLDGTAYLGQGSSLSGFGPEFSLLSGTYMLEGNNSALSAAIGTTMTIAAPVEVHLKSGMIGRIGGQGSHLVNHGTFTSDGGDLQFRFDSFTNHGLIDVSIGHLLIGEANQSPWQNLGTIRLTDSTMLARGLYTNLGTLERTGGMIELGGTFLNENNITTLNASTGSIRMQRVEIIGGTLNLTEGATLLFDDPPFTGPTATFRNLTLSGDFELPRNTSGNAQPALHLREGLTLDGEIRLSGAGSSIRFADSQTVSGGTIALEGPGGGERTLEIPSGLTVTLAEGTTLRGGSGRVASVGVTAVDTRLVNHGLVSADLQGQTLSLTPHLISNHGTLEARSGGTLRVGSSSTNWHSDGLLRVNDGTMILGGRFNIAQSAFERSGGTVAIEGILDNSGSTLNLGPSSGYIELRDGSEIRGGTVNIAPGGGFTFGSPSGHLKSRFHELTLHGDLTLPRNLSQTIDISGGFNFDGEVTLRGGSISLSTDPQTLNGGTFIFDHTTSPTGYFQADRPNSLQTFGPDTTIRGGNGIIRYRYGMGPTYAETMIRNEGLISADVPDERIRIQIGQFFNDGIVEARNGGLLFLDHDTTLFNTGILRVFQDSHLWLGSKGRTSDLGTIINDGGTVRLMGELNNAGSTLTLNQQTGTWQWGSGRIKGGTLALTEGSTIYAEHGNGWLFGVTVEGDLELRDGGRLFIYDGLTMDGTARLMGSGALMSFGSVDPVLTSGTIRFEGETGNYRRVAAQSGTTMTIGPDATIRGGRGEVFTSGQGTIVNQGNIIADVAGQEIRVHMHRFRNEGTIEAISGGHIEFIPPPPFGPDPSTIVNQHLLSVGAGSLVNLQAPFTQSHSGTLRFTLSGAEPGDFGIIRFEDSLRLDGTLQLILAGGYSPVPGATFHVLDFDPQVLSGSFGLLDFPMLSGGRGWDTSALYSSGVVSVIPAPGSLLVLMIGALASMRRRRGTAQQKEVHCG